MVLNNLLCSVAALLQTFVDGQQKERISFQASGPNTGLEIMGQSLYIGGLPDSFPLNRFTQKSVPPFWCLCGGVFVCVCVRVCVHMCLCVSVSLTVCLSLTLSFSLPVSLSVYLSLCLCVSLSVSVYVFVHAEVLY